ncbi:unnamed protein product [Prorocentrum cordatum]|uniref:Uncharacterized protein n=1 Tax=Prorocentrum cordatum TaxID=2364126 RepID=A0ABN9UVR7_9DINO|nr:unnamed protein product [Polarella glacialis]
MSRSRFPTRLAPLATEHADMDTVAQEHQTTHHAAAEHAALAPTLTATAQADLGSVAQQHESTDDVATEHAVLDRTVVQPALEGARVPTTLQDAAQVVKANS